MGAALASLPRIVRFLGTDDCPDAECPHCGATGRFIHRFQVEDGRQLGAMSGCVKLFPVRPIAQADMKLSEKERLTKKAGRIPASWDVEKRKILDRFYAGEITEGDAMGRIHIENMKAKNYAQRRFR